MLEIENNSMDLKSELLAQVYSLILSWTGTNMNGNPDSEKFSREPERPEEVGASDLEEVSMNKNNH